ncbi:MAG: hypothetical protein AB1679_00480 [Actinomycetota bacterium]
MTTAGSALLSQDQEAQLDRLLGLRQRLLQEQAAAMSPAVERALRLADVYLFLALGYYGYTEHLLPEDG